ncbi:hypothetical protein EKO27_g11678 [Xylaria grammica]|uniref:Uncharacterized protein n=1 Tax=Xylaria grammica TaxID=363999 RepID=A0A439CMN7_9PEZI|nr:hypothetical protein EKO27_g11678 [Xylaria grammica]
MTEKVIADGRNIDTVAAHTASMHPQRQPSEQHLYTSVKKDLTVIAETREKNGYKLPTDPFRVPTREEIEALRIHGSAEWGFGTIPGIIEVLLTRTGLVWLALPDAKAKMSKYWLSYYSKIAMPNPSPLRGKDSFIHLYAAVVAISTRSGNPVVNPLLSIYGYQVSK